MCGGRGTRLNRGEKPLVEVGGDPMVDRVLAALEGSRVDRVHAVTSPYVPETAAHLDGRVPCIEAAGEGYVADLAEALGAVDGPVLSADSSGRSATAVRTGPSTASRASARSAT